ncbi:MAG: hypothetical protein AAFY15_16120, partial [Cyanobacteria bacterium J06648_11]
IFGVGLGAVGQIQRPLTGFVKGFEAAIAKGLRNLTCILNGSVGQGGDRAHGLYQRANATILSRECWV